jgi:diguanylate cyclase (GGDEF)-like protein
VTVSIGVAAWPGDGEKIEDALAAADRRLYDAKRKGRNRVIGPASRSTPA